MPALPFGMEHHDWPSHNQAQEGECHVALTEEVLDVKALMDRVRSPEAGAIVVFAGSFKQRALHPSTSA